MKTHHLPAQGSGPKGRDRLWQSPLHDSYQLPRKLQEPTACPTCGAVYHRGRWAWLPRPEGASSTLCPACRRQHDHFPAGFVTLRGERLQMMREALLHVIRHAETRERDQHPLARIMAIEEGDGEWLVTTTDIHLARRIGEALQRAGKGALEFRYNRAQHLLRVHWTA